MASATAAKESQFEVEIGKSLDPPIPWEDITCILWHNNFLFTSVTSAFLQTTSGCNGRVDVWDKNLSHLGHFMAHDYGLYHMCGGLIDTIYTCASDSTICHWRVVLTKGEGGEDNDTNPVHLECQRLALLKGHLEPPWRMQFFNGRLFSGDELGEIRMWENDIYRGVLETFEEIWDLLVIPHYIFTVRNLEVVVQTMPEKESLRKACAIKNTIPGSGPLFISHKRIFCVHRRSFDILVYSLTEFGNPLLTSLNGHKSIITTFVGNEDVLFSADYDGQIFAWDLNQLCQIAKLELNNETISNGCVNVLTFDPKEFTLYAAQEKKRLLKIRFYMNANDTESKDESGNKNIKPK